MRVARLVAAGLLLSGVLVSVGRAQAPGPAVPVPPPPGGQADFRTGVTLVTTDVIPRTSKGAFVTDLTKDDFTVIENGTPQTISSFTLVNGGRVFNLLAPEEKKDEVPEGIIIPNTRKVVSNVTSGRVLVIFVDDLHIESQYTPHVRRLVQQMVTNLLHDGDLVAMVSSGPSAIEINPTMDLTRVTAAVQQIRGNGITAQEIFQSLETSQGPADLRYRAQVAFQTMYNMVAGLDAVQNRRKAIVYISTGYDFDPYSQGRNSRDRIQGGRFSDPLRFLIDQENPYFRIGAVTADIDLYAYMRELTLSANRTNASIFTIDPRGLAGVTDAGQYLDQSEVRTFLQKTISTLRYLAEETGGFPVVNDNDFVSALKRIDAETSDYYVLGYYSTNVNDTSRVRDVEITVKRPGVEVNARKSYTVRTPGVLPRPVLPPPPTPRRR